MKEAFLVLGAESSGTRMLTQVLTGAGCYGDFSHEQRMDNLIFDNLPDRIVFRRSFPHGDSWPKIEDIVYKLRDVQYQVNLLVIMRDKDFCVASQMREGHELTEYQCHWNIIYAMNLIFEAVGILQIFPKVILYEPFVTNEFYRNSFMNSIGLTCPEMKFFNANEQYSLEQIIKN